MRSGPSDSPVSREELLISLGRLMSTCGGDEFPAQFRQFFAEVSRAPSFSVLAFQKGAVPVLLTSSGVFNDEGHERYLGGLYLLDPYYELFNEENFSGFAKWEDIAPDNYEETIGPYWDYFSEWDFLDEAGYLVPLSNETSLHLSLCRNRDMRRFGPGTIALLTELYPIVAALMTRQWQHFDQAIDTRESERRLLHDQVRYILHEFGSSVLTAREREIVQLMLKGYSYRAIADALGISPGTVNTHRANIYEKLDISSNGELFSLLIDAMTSIQAVEGEDILTAYLQKPS